MAALPPLIRQMLQPEFYPHPVTEPITLHQTHISYVLLTGDYAYKVKKPVDFGFLDFTSLEKRHHFCHEELRLNRRLAPDLYLAILPITKDPESGQFRLSSGVGQQNAVEEYIVQMHQFEQDGFQLLNQGYLTSDHMKALGQQLAAFHRTAKTDEVIQAYGSVDAIRRVEENNFMLSQPFIGRSQTQAQFDQTYSFVGQFFSDHADWFERRQTEGKIREGHGDLHLGNLCLYQGALQVFDCIEFNPAFRNIDGIYDVAFLVMDLMFHQRTDLANVLLNTYLEQTGDYGGGVLLPPYLSMRAYIRGNVNSFALDDPAITPPKKQRSLDRARAYYHLAWTYTQRPQGQLILMSGLSGSGKSTVARQLAQQINAIHIRSDAVRKHLAGIPLDQDDNSGDEYGDDIYTPDMTQKTYDRLLELGVLLAQEGWSVILDAKYDRHALRQAVIFKAEAGLIPVKILPCLAPLEVLAARLQQRAGDISDATAELLPAQQQATEPFTAEEQQVVVPIYTDREVSKQLAALFPHLFS